MLGKLLEALSGGKWDFVWAQQWFTMTDQLNMGVRRLMLDPVYFWGAMRLCHCGATFKWFDDVLHFIEKVRERFLEVFVMGGVASFPAWFEISDFFNGPGNKAWSGGGILKLSLV